MKLKLNDTSIGHLNPPPGKRLTAWDTDLAGFGCRCITSIRGKTTRTFVVKYRVRPSTTYRWVSVGRADLVSARDARGKAKNYLSMAELGEDPQAVRDADKLMLNFSQAWEIFLQQHVESKRKAKTIRDYRNLAKNHLLPAFANMKIDKVDHAAISALHRKLNSKPRMANYLLSVLSSMFSYLRKAKIYTGENPVSDIEKYRENKRERYLSNEEFERLSKTLMTAEKNYPLAVAAIRLLLLTGCRYSEIVKARWNDWDKEQHLLYLPDTKTGARTIQLSQSETSILNKLELHHKMIGNPFLLPGTGKNGFYQGLPKIWRKLRSEIGLDDLRIHDLRHSYASTAAAGGMSLPMIGKLLGHSQSSTTERYAHIGQSPERAARERVSGDIARKMNMDTGVSPDTHSVPNLAPISDDV